MQNAMAAWDAFKAAPDAELRKEFDANTVSTADRTSPYLWRKVGDKPANGWGLVIAMHGGGNAPKSVNDGEWRYMFNGYYKDHPEAGGYIYLALRAPNDTWNGFYDDAISPMVERLILQFVKFEDVDPSRVYACGASHGGYGAFVIGPKIPYRFAAVHPAASPDRRRDRGRQPAESPFHMGGGRKGHGLRPYRTLQSVSKAVGRVESRVWRLRRRYGDGPGRGHMINAFEANKTAELAQIHPNGSPNPRDLGPKRQRASPILLV